MTCPQHPMGCRCGTYPRPAQRPAPSELQRCGECGDDVVYVSTDGLCDGCVEIAALEAETAASEAAATSPAPVVFSSAPEPYTCPPSGLRGYVHRWLNRRSAP